MNAAPLGGSNRLLSAKETAARLGVAVDTLYRQREEWGLRAYRVGQALKFRERDIEAWLASVEVQPRYPRGERAGRFWVPRA